MSSGFNVASTNSDTWVPDSVLGSSSACVGSLASRWFELQQFLDEPFSDLVQFRHRVASNQIPSNRSFRSGAGPSFLRRPCMPQVTTRFLGCSLTASQTAFRVLREQFAMLALCHRHDGRLILSPPWDHWPIRLLGTCLRLFSAGSPSPRRPPPQNQCLSVLREVETQIRGWKEHT